VVIQVYPVTPGANCYHRRELVSLILINMKADNLFNVSHLLGDGRTACPTDNMPTLRKTSKIKWTLRL
jgi:hypothetical protein